MRHISTVALLASGLLAVSMAGAQAQGSGTVGSGGSAAAGTTSASTLGLGATSTGTDGTSSAIGTGGSAASAGGKADSRSRVHGNDNHLMGNSKAMAHDGGTFSKSQTKTRVDPGESLSSRTKTMSHEPGSKPVKSTTETTVPVQ
jgi:hypothetical protein